MNLAVNIRTIGNQELLAAFHMQNRAFLPTFLKYRDKINPIFTPYKTFKRKMQQDDRVAFWVLSNGVRVGQIQLVLNANFIHITHFFILPKYQNQGIGQKALQLIEEAYTGKPWHLFTIKQEQRNIHLYEKFGYRATGMEKRIIKRMTLKEYEKNGI